MAEYQPSYDRGKNQRAQEVTSEAVAPQETSQSDEVYVQHQKLHRGSRRCQIWRPPHWHQPQTCESLQCRDGQAAERTNRFERRGLGFNLSGKLLGIFFTTIHLVRCMHKFSKLWTCHSINICLFDIVVNFRNSWGVLVFKVGGLRIRLGSVDGHWNWYGGYTDLDNEVEHEIKITINPTGQCLPACPCRTYGLIVVWTYIWYMLACSVRHCLSVCFLFL